MSLEDIKTLPELGCNKEDLEGARIVEVAEVCLEDQDKANQSELGPGFSLVYVLGVMKPNGFEDYLWLAENRLSGSRPAKPFFSVAASDLAVYNPLERRN